MPREPEKRYLNRKEMLSVCNRPCFAVPYYFIHQLYLSILLKNRQLAQPFGPIVYLRVQTCLIIKIINQVDITHILAAMNISSLKCRINTKHYFFRPICTLTTIYS